MQKFRSAPLSQRGQVSPFLVMDVMRAAALREQERGDVLHMEVGQPATGAPKKVIAAAHKALDQQLLGYTGALGMSALRERIAGHYRDSYHVAVDPGQIVITTGSSAAFVLAFLAAFDEGARVALPSPGYPCYRHILQSLSVETVIMPVGDDNRWMPTASQLGDLSGQGKIDGVLLASPANPTGAMLADRELERLVQDCDRHGRWFISDEIYHGLTYHRPARTALEFGSNVIVINSFSKYFSMTGWRIGWMVVPRHMVRTVERLVQNLFISAPTLSQYGAIAAFDAIEELEEHKKTYRTNRDLLLDAFAGAGLDRFAPADGAFYLYADVSDYTGDNLEFAARILKETGVAVTSGADFDSQDGRNFLRFSYARSTTDMEQAAKRLSAWFQKL